MPQSFQKIKGWSQKHEHALSSAAFILGFMWDNVMISGKFSLFDNLILTGYLAFACFSIIVFQLDTRKRFAGRLTENFILWLPFLMQFSFGGLFSGYIIYYSRSASLIGNWPFLLFLATLFIGNEFFKKHYQRLAFQLSIFFVTLFSYTIFSIPVLLGKMGANVFLLSGIVSLSILGLIIFFLKQIVPSQIQAAKKSLAITIVFLYLLFNVAYFTNIIPPIPLSPKEIGVYHLVAKSKTGGYELTFEPAPKFLSFFTVQRTADVFHQSPSEPIYIFSSIFAPANLSTKILHRWSYYDEASVSFIMAANIAFPISGGRDQGYRGYSVKGNVFPGKWRVDVMTEDGKLIERKEFTVVAATTTPYTEKTLE